METQRLRLCLSESRLLFITVHHTFYKMNLLLFFQLRSRTGLWRVLAQCFSVGAASVSDATIFTPAQRVFLSFFFRTEALSCYLLTDIDVLSSLRKRLLLLLPECLTWLTESCLSVSQSPPYLFFACELQITAQQRQACSRQRQGFALSSAPCSRLWVLCHVTLAEIDPPPHLKEMLRRVEGFFFLLFYHPSCHPPPLSRLPPPPTTHMLSQKTRREAVPGAR